MTHADPDKRAQSRVRRIFETYYGLTGYLDRAAQWAIGAGILGVFVMLVLQVLVRYVLPFPLPWVEEAAVYLSAYVALVGASVCLRAGYHLQVELLRELLGPFAQLVLLILQQALVIGFALFIVRYGYAFVELGRGQTSPSTYFLVSHARMAMPIGGALLAIQALAVIGRAVTDYNETNQPPNLPPGADQPADM